jgi:hypothetical protein
MIVGFVCDFNSQWRFDLFSRLSFSTKEQLWPQFTFSISLFTLPSKGTSITKLFLNFLDSGKMSKSNKSFLRRHRRRETFLLDYCDVYFVFSSRKNQEKFSDFLRFSFKISLSARCFCCKTRNRLTFCSMKIQIFHLLFYQFSVFPFSTRAFRLVFATAEVWLNLNIQWTARRDVKEWPIYVHSPPQYWIRRAIKPRVEKSVLRKARKLMLVVVVRHETLDQSFSNGFFVTSCKDFPCFPPVFTVVWFGCVVVI